MFQFQSLKKEVDWGGGGEEKHPGETSLEYSRHMQGQDSVSFWMNI